MLVPTEEEALASPYPCFIPYYGRRGWCRVEYFIFSLWAGMLGQAWDEMRSKWDPTFRTGEVQLYAILRDGRLEPFPTIEVTGEDDLPTHGALSNPNDMVAVN